MSNKTFTWVVVFILLVIGVLAFYIYSMSNDKRISISISDITNKISVTNEEDEEENNPSTQKEEDEKVSELKEVTKYTDFFNINKVINDYYVSLTTLDNAKTYNMLDKTYIKAHNITKQNCSNLLEEYYNDISFFAEEMYEKHKAGVYYYFVKGSTENYDMSTEVLDLGENAYFLIIVDNINSTFAVYPLTGVDNIRAYGIEYNVPKNKEISDNDNNTYLTARQNDNLVSTFYLSHYSNLIYLNTEKAYNMLGKSTKAKYPKLEDFSKDLTNISNILNTKLTGINSTGEEGKKTIKLSDGKSVSITIKEKSINNFEIDF